MKKIIQILGPTGVGKTKVALDLAKRLNGEIISADSMQVYKGFDIGTDKVGLKKRKEIPHHLIDILSDCSQFNASRFLEKSFEISEDIQKRNKIPIVCGGTALYLKTMVKGIFPESSNKRVTRETLERICTRVGLTALWEKLNQVDPDYAQKVGLNDRKRIIRALEIYYNNDLPPTEIFRRTKSPFKNYSFIRVGLNIPREKLYRRIEKRVDEMINKGLVEEVVHLKDVYPNDCPPFKSLGYKEILMYLHHESICLEEAVMLIKQHSRNYAKRQLSWFRKESDIHWFQPHQINEIEEYIINKLSN